MNKRAQVRVFGVVQGVFFRENAKEEADNLGLVGWVKNEPDGTVLIDAEGHAEDLAELITWCKSGSPNAVVEKVETQELPVKNQDEEFSVVY